MWCDHKKLCVLNSYPQIVHCVKTIGHLYVRGKEYMKGVELPLTSSTVGTYTGSCWLPNTVMYELFTSIYGFGGRCRLKGKARSFSLRVSSRYLYAWNISFIEYNITSGTWKEKRSTPWVNFDDKSKFCGEKYIGSSRLNIYRFSFASHLRMAHELSLKVYKVKACLLRLQCRVSSKI